MGMTITEKIFAKASGKEKVSPGENVWLNVDVLMTHDVCGPPTIQIWKEKFGEEAKIWDKNKFVILPDHYIHTKNVRANRNVEFLREFARKENLPHYYDVDDEGCKGVCHIVLAEEGFNLPGSVLFGTDSHSCTSGAFGMFATGVGNTDAAFILGTGKIWEKVPKSIKVVFNGEMPEYLTAKDLILYLLGEIGTAGATYMALEFTGEAIATMDMNERMTLTNMAIEAGAMNGIIAVDEVTKKYIKTTDYVEFQSDPDASYERVIEADVEKIEPVVAKPHSPDNRDFISNLEEVEITKAYIGSCTGGKITDYQYAAKILYENKVCVPTYIIPSTAQVEAEVKRLKYKNKTLEEIFLEAGCLIEPPSCGACLGGPEDTKGRSVDYDVVVSTTNRNYPGRMGSKTAEIYLASPLTTAASAVNGKMSDPRKILEAELC